MPNWKKVVTSGSNAILNNVSASGIVTAQNIIIDNGDSGSITLGQHNIGFELLNLAFPITGSGLIVSQSFTNEATHHNMVKIGETELVDISGSATTDSFLINVREKSLIVSSSTLDKPVAELAAGRTIFYSSTSGQEAIRIDGDNLTLGDDSAITVIEGSEVQMNSAQNRLRAAAATPTSNAHLLFSKNNPETSVSTTTDAARVLSTPLTSSFPYLGGAVTASAVSSSGNLFASLSLNSSHLNTVMYNTTTGQFFFTGSYGGGGGGSTPTLQQVTDVGATTTNGSLFLQNQTLDYGFSNGQNATSGFRSDGTNAFTHVTPQRFENRFYILGTIDAAGPAPFPNNYIVFDKPLVYQGFSGGGGGGGNDGGPQDDEPSRPQIQGEMDIVLLNPRTTAGTSSRDPKGGILITPGSSDPGIYFFTNDASGSVSGSHLINSASAQIRFSTGSNAIKFFAGSTNETLKEVLHISKSGDNPRIGIGTTDPKTVFDFKDVEDTTTGAELLIRSARSTRGALTGDEGGSINFIIDSGSFVNLKTSGSIAKIKTKVTDIGVGGAQGNLAFELSKAAGGTTVDVFEYGFSIGGQSLFAAVQTASLVIKDFSATGKSTLQMRDFFDGLRFEVNDGLLYASGNISSSGDLFINDVTASGNISSSAASTASFGSLKIDGASVDFSGLPTSDPGIAGRLYNSASFVKISAG
jgi:hypothetical protein